MNIKENLYKILYTMLAQGTMIIVFLILVWFFTINQQNKASNYFIGKNAITFIVNNSSKLKYKNLSEVYNDMKDFTLSVISKDIKNDVTNVKIIIKGRVETPKLKSGRFLNEEDYFKEDHYAVVGKNILESSLIIKLDDRRFYKYENNKYEIVGVIDDKNPILNSTAFLTIRSIDNIEDCNLIIDGNSKKKIKNNYDKIAERYNINQIPTERNSIESSINNIEQQYNIIIGIATFLGIFTIIISRTYYTKIKSEVSIKVLLGINKKEILGEMVKTIAITYIINWLIILILCILVNIFGMNWTSILGLTILCQVVLGIIPITVMIFTYKYCVNNIYESNF